MVIKIISENVLKSEAKHISFAVNKEGYNNLGFAGQVSSNCWEELANCGEHEIGTILSKTVDDKTYHALVCYSLKKIWDDNQAEIIKECFDKIPVNGEPIATIAIGTGLIEVSSGADFRKIVCGMHDSQQQIILYADCSLDEVINCYNTEKGKTKVLKPNKRIIM